MISVGRSPRQLATLLTSALLALVLLVPGWAWAEDAIVVLGSPFTAEGKPRAPVLRRMKTALEQARRFPKATVVVTGGAVQGQAEGPQMAKWLVAAGVDPKRLRVESKARHTGENATLSLPILRQLGARSAIIVTDRAHLTRARLHFRWALADAGGKGIALRGVGADEGLRGFAGTRLFLREGRKIVRDSVQHLAQRWSRGVRRLRPHRRIQRSQSVQPSHRLR